MQKQKRSKFKQRIIAAIAYYFCLEKHREIFLYRKCFLIWKTLNDLFLYFKEFFLCELKYEQAGLYIFTYGFNFNFIFLKKYNIFV